LSASVAGSGVAGMGVYGGEIMPRRRREKSARPTGPEATDGEPSAAAAQPSEGKTALSGKNPTSDQRADFRSGVEREADQR
jgi:hypothetical protein